jgi:hypothetical protein
VRTLRGLWAASGMPLVLVMAAITLLAPDGATAQPAATPVAVHSEISVTATSGGAQHQTLSINGSADFNLGSDPSAQVQLQSPQGALEVIETGNTIYTRQGSGPWQSQMVSTTTSIAQQFGEIGSQTWLSNLMQRGITVQKLPDETVDGVAAQHSQVSMTEQQALSLIGGVSALTGNAALPASQLSQALDASDGATFQIDTWNGVADGFPYRVVISLQAPSTGSGAGG